MKNKEMKKVENANGTLPENFREELQDFVEYLNREPDAQEITKLPSKSGEVQYIPISVIEQKLDYIFNGLWQTRNMDTRIVANEIVVSIELGVFHPIAKTWIYRQGIGAAMIRQYSGSSVSDLDAKIKDTLSMDAPNALAEAIKNAAKKFGKTFGRELNRQIVHPYDHVREREETRENWGQYIADLKEKLAEVKSLEELKDLYRLLPIKGPEVYQLVNQAKNRLA